MRIRITRRTGGVSAVMLLAAASAISQAVPARASTIPSFEVAYAGAGGELFTFQTGTGTITDQGYSVEPGTNPGAGGGQVSAQSPVFPGPAYRVFMSPWPTFEGTLGVDFQDLDFAAQPGTSPAVTANTGNVAFAGGEDPTYFDAFSSAQAGDIPDRLFIWGNNPSTGLEGSVPTDQIMAANTSPAIAGSSFFFNAGNGSTISTSDLQAAFQGTNGNLQEWLTGQETESEGGGTHNIGGTLDTDVPMATGTSPAITPDSYDTELGSFAEAVQGSNGVLAVYSDNIGEALQTNVLMNAGTSPAIASDGSVVDTDVSLNSFAHIEAAFQGANNDLYTASSPETTDVDDTLQTVDTGVAMSPGTNPAIVFAGSAYWIAFQGTNHDLWLYSSASGGLDTGISMTPGSSPAIG
jgi:hypothetical protein